MRLSKTNYNNLIVITIYCNGKPLDQIAKETSLSKGSVYNVVKHWKDSLWNPGIEEIREFSIIVKKSGMTIQECAQGFRIAQILKELGINDEFEERNDSDPKRDLLEEIKNETIGWDKGKDDPVLASPDIGFTKKINKDVAAKMIFTILLKTYTTNVKNMILNHPIL
jgi:hypothetical protein